MSTETKDRAIEFNHPEHGWLPAEADTQPLSDTIRPTREHERHIRVHLPNGRDQVRMFRTHGHTVGHWRFVGDAEPAHHDEPPAGVHSPDTGAEPANAHTATEPAIEMHTHTPAAGHDAPRAEQQPEPLPGIAPGEPNQDVPDEGILGALPPQDDRPTKGRR